MSLPLYRLVNSIRPMSISRKQRVIHVVGAGLAGVECALQLADAGLPVCLWEMKSIQRTPAQKEDFFAELVCSNSFGSLQATSATGQLKAEAKMANSFVLKAAEIAKVPAGQALGVDRVVFGQMLTQWVHEHPLITVKSKVIESLLEVPRPAVIATGPLTGEGLAKSLQNVFGSDFLYFFDAIAPVIATDSIDMNIAWKADRYGKGSADYINCPLDKPQYQRLVKEIAESRKIEPKHFESTPYFEGCMPIEEMVRRGPQTLRFGPLKPVGLDDPRTGRWAYATVQLRQDNQEGTAYNMVGFQTRMAYPEQKRIFSLIPGLENAEFVKMGSMHRNLYIHTPTKLTPLLQARHDENLFFAGQITGVEGYFESAMIGLLVARILSARELGYDLVMPPRATAFGSLLAAITDPHKQSRFQPTNINFSLFPPLAETNLPKADRKLEQLRLANEAAEKWLKVARCDESRVWGDGTGVAFDGIEKLRSHSGERTCDIAGQGL